MKYLPFLLLLLPQLLWAQVPDRPDDVDESEEEIRSGEIDDNNEAQFLIENLVEDADATEFDFDTEFERLETYRSHPIDLNFADREDLQGLGLLSSIQIQAIVNYRRELGQIYSLYELPNIPTLDLATAQRILPYVTIAGRKEQRDLPLGKILKYSRRDLFVRYQRILETKEGYRDLAPGEDRQRYLGSPDKLYLRFRQNYRNRYSFGVTMEKDAGEEFFTGSNVQGFDYYSAHLFIRRLHKNVKAVAVGDYQVFLGQGLAVWGGFGARKGAATVNIKRYSDQLRPYTSVNEALFMRGAATTLQFAKENALTLTLFGSHRNRDANASVVDTLDDEALEVSSLQETGLHRTPNEVEDENSIRQSVAGGSLKWRGSTYSIAANAVYNQLSAPLTRTGQLFNSFAFNGTSLFNASLDYAYLYKNIQFFGETALSSTGGAATFNGLLAHLGGSSELSLFHRYYDPRYQTLTGNALGEGTRVNNESGFYLGFQTELTRGLQFNAYADIFQFPWLRFNVDAPSRGHEYFLRLQHSPKSWISWYAQYRFEEKGRNRVGNESAIDFLVPTQRQSLRFHLRYKVASEVELRSRAEWSFYEDHQYSRGFMLYQDIIYSPRWAPLKAQMRLALIDTDDYDTRIYAYENDVLYAFSVPAYYGRSTRFYLNLSYKASRRLSFWLRFSQTYFADREEISTGLEMIEGRTRSEVKAQLRLRF